MKPLDFVKTPKGNIAFIKEIQSGEYRVGEKREIKELITASIEFLGGGNPDGEYNAWWFESELEIIDNLSSLLARDLVNPFGHGREIALKIYPIK